MNNLIGLVLAAPREKELMRPALEFLQHWSIPYDVLLTSPWASPERLLGWLEQATLQGMIVILAAAEAEPQLPGLIAAASRLPVIAVPAAGGAEMLAPILRVTSTAPVAAVRPGDAAQAVLLAVRILAAAEPHWARVIDAHGEGFLETLNNCNAELKEDEVKPEKKSPRHVEPESGASPAVPALPRREAPSNPPRESEVQYADGGDGGEPIEIRPAEHLNQPLASRPAARSEPEAAPPPSPLRRVPARKLGRRRIDADTPEFDLIEETVDCLLEGGVIALPTDTVYGVAADATNPAAVERLYEIKGRPRNKAIVIFVDSPKLLSGIACNLSVEVRRLMEAFWPGPLTIIFQKRPGNFMHISDTDTIGVRLPDHSVPLAIMQALVRPLACTSANLAGRSECLSADEVEENFGDDLNLILDGGILLDHPPSTVLDVTRDPFRILRRGSVTEAQISAIVGDRFEAE